MGSRPGLRRPSLQLRLRISAFFTTYRPHRHGHDRISSVNRVILLRVRLLRDIGTIIACGRTKAIPEPSAIALLGDGLIGARVAAGRRSGPEAFVRCNEQA